MNEGRQAPDSNDASPAVDRHRQGAEALILVVPWTGRAPGMSAGRKLARLTLVLAVIMALLGSTGAQAAAIENGAPVAAPNTYPQVGLVLVPFDDGHFEMCTSTLVAPTWVLTAAHCLQTPGYDASRGPITVKLNMIDGSDPNAVTRETTSGVIADGFDLALLHVDPVTDIVPMALATPDNKPSYEKGTIATAIAAPHHDNGNSRLHGMAE